MTYTIQDHVRDDGSDVNLLPCATYFLRMLMRTQYALSQHIPGAGELFRTLMNEVDDANAWEEHHCRAASSIPRFNDRRTLASRSIGHVAGLLAMLLFAGHDRASEEYAATLAFFRHYLIARQLHDDAHDWADDLARGSVNSAAAIVLADAGADHTDTHSIPELRKIFWRTSVDTIARIINQHVAAARTSRARSCTLRDSNLLKDDLRTFASGAHRALRERDLAAGFLRHYGTKTASGTSP